MATRPRMKRPGYTATGRQWQTIEALREDGWAILDRGQADDAALSLKRAANLLFNLAQVDQLDDNHRQQMKDAVKALDPVIRTLGSSPYTVAWPLHRNRASKSHD